MSRSLQKKECINCHISLVKGTTSSYNWNLKKFCSKRCNGIYGGFKKDHGKVPPLSALRFGPKNNRWKGGQLTKECAICTQSFKVDQYRHRAKTCSMECNKLYRKTSEFRLRISDIQRAKISQEWLSLTENIKKFRNLLRRCSKYQMWREEIFKRDNFTCCVCYSRGGKLQADHIDPFIAILVRNDVQSYEEALKCRELWDIRNGRTLCIPCHQKTPSFGSKVHKMLKLTNQNAYE